MATVDEGNSRNQTGKSEKEEIMSRRTTVLATVMVVWALLETGARLTPIEKPNLPAERLAQRLTLIADIGHLKGTGPGFSQSDSGFQARLVQSYGQLPLSF